MSYPDGSVEAHAHEGAGSISVPWVIASALLCGLGLWLIAYWLLNITGGPGGWIYFLGVPILIGGALMFLNPRMGLDHA
jgi:hypothetical protein